MTDKEKKNDQIDKQTIEDQKNSMEQKSEKSDSLEDKSLEELHKQIEKGKRKASRSIVFAAAALIAIVSIGVAWFASNSTVTATGSRISAEAPISFLLGSEGQRQSGETTYLTLKEGEAKIYSAWVDVEAKQKISENSTIESVGKKIYIGNTNLAWYLNGQGNESLVPGANGKLEFYIIPQQSGIKSAEITLKLEAYVADDNNKVKKSEDDDINNLINGHILLFQYLNDTEGYSDWLEPTDNGEYTFTVKNPGVIVGENESDDSNTSEEVFEKGVPYKITLYWVWPNYFRNYIYTQRSTQGDLFTSKSVNSDARKKLLEFVDKQNVWSTSRLFYQKSSNETSQQTSTSTSGSVISGTINDQISDEDLNTCSNYYNQADEYIGNNVQYAYVEIKVTEGTSSDAAANTN